MATTTKTDNFPFRYDFDIYQGNGWSRTLTYKNSAGTAVDLSSYTATLTIKDKKGGNTILSLTSDSGITLNASGQIIIAITNAQSLTLTIPEYYYELYLTLAGTNYYFCYGKFLVEQKV